LELLKGLIVPVVFASLREILTIQPNRAAYVMRILIVEDETLSPDYARGLAGVA
jgi:hypothetical protein